MKYKKLPIYLISIILLIIPVLADDINITLGTPANGSTETSGLVDFTFTVNMTCNCSLYINDTFNRSMNLTSDGTFIFSSIPITNGDYFWNVSGVNHSNSAIAGGSETFEFTMQTLTGTLTVTECPVQSTAAMLALWLVVLISLFFLAIGFTQKLGIIGFFGALMFMVASWFIAPCQPFFALVCSVFSLILMIWFIITHIGMKK